MFVGQAVDEMDLGADTECGARRRLLDGTDDEVGRPDLIGDLAHVA